MIFHSSLHKQRLWNLLKQFQFDEKQHLTYLVCTFFCIFQCTMRSSTLIMFIRTCFDIWLICCWLTCKTQNESCCCYYVRGGKIYQNLFLILYPKKWKKGNHQIESSLMIYYYIEINDNVIQWWFSIVLMKCFKLCQFSIWE